MKIQKLGAAAFVVGIVLTCLGGRVFAQQTNQAKTAAGPQTVATNFIADAILSPAEIEQVVTLAKACGMESPGRIETIRLLPGGDKGINVYSVGRVEGRNTVVDFTSVLRKNWGAPEPSRDAKQVGDFWSKATMMYSIHLRRYDFRKESIQVEIGRGTDTAVADKIMALIEANDVRVGRNSAGAVYEQFKRSKPTRLSENGSKASYCLEFEGKNERLLLEWKNEQIVITGVSHPYV